MSPPDASPVEDGAQVPRDRAPAAHRPPRDASPVDDSARGTGRAEAAPRAGSGAPAAPSGATVPPAARAARSGAAPTDGAAPSRRTAPVVPAVDPERLAGVQAGLLAWYERQGRDLPWRRTRDPYTILVSEIMLQQTQVERVIPKLAEWLAAFPTFDALAAASVADVIRVWKGLGYNRRAVRLQAIARVVVERFGGRLPDTPAGLRELEGLGAYTSNAVACFAYGQPVPVVDTNVRRVLGRVFADAIGLDPPAGPRLDRFAESVLPRDRAYDWNQAVMDLGATVCTARNPDHDRCPLALQCAGRALLPSRADLLRAAEAPAEYGASPARRAGRTKGTPFEQTTRFYRGRIVDRLRDLSPGETLGLDDLGVSLRDDFGPEHAAWVAALVEGLRRDGLAAVIDGPEGPRVSLP